MLPAGGATFDQHAPKPRPVEVHDRPARVRAEADLIDPSVGAIQPHERVLDQVLGDRRVAGQEVRETQEELVLGGEPLAELIQARLRWLEDPDSTLHERTRSVHDPYTPSDLRRVDASSGRGNVGIRGPRRWF